MTTEQQAQALREALGELVKHLREGDFELCAGKGLLDAACPPLGRSLAQGRDQEDHPGTHRSSHRRVRMASSIASRAIGALNTAGVPADA